MPPAFLIVVGIPLLVRIRRSSTGERSVLVGGLVAAMLACAPVLGFELGRFGTESERLVYYASAFVVPAAFVAFYVAFGDRLARVVSIVFLLGHASATWYAQGRWVDASDMTREIVSALATLEPTTTCIANLPDSVGGAFVFRQGLAQAVAFHARRPVEPFRVARVQRWGLRESASFESTGEGGRLRLSELAKLGPSGYPPCEASRVEGVLSVASADSFPGVTHVVFVARDEGIRLHVVPVRGERDDGSNDGQRRSL